MPFEIERKFLVNDRSYRLKAKGRLFRQAYIPMEDHNTLRVRIVGKKAFLTLKGRSEGFSRLEFEYSVPLKHAEAMLDGLCRRPFIEKVRYEYRYKGHLWEIDEFLGENEGLVVAEIELKAETESFVKPSFIGDEVTGDHRYSNSQLVIRPFKSW